MDPMGFGMLYLFQVFFAVKLSLHRGMNLEILTSFSQFFRAWPTVDACRNLRFLKGETNKKSPRNPQRSENTEETYPKKKTEYLIAPWNLKQPSIY